MRDSDSDHILVSKLTGFVFYRDHRLDRKILVGVHEENVNVYNYFVGPFDQLPDNFIEGDTLRNAILKLQPNLKGQIDRFSGIPDGAVRYMVGPCRLCRHIDQFKAADRCAARNRGSAAAYYRCFIFDDKPQDLRRRPLEETLPANARKSGSFKPRGQAARRLPPSLHITLCDSLRPSRDPTIHLLFTSAACVTE